MLCQKFLYEWTMFISTDINALNLGHNRPQFTCKPAFKIELVMLEFFFYL